jgi:multifunctional 2-oxoglutarate metabolism enzyme
LATDVSNTTVPVLLPELGESVTEGAIVEWRKAVGDSVEAGETLVDVTTDKVDVEIPSPAGGVLSRIVAEAGATVEVGALLAEIASGNGASPAAPAPEAAAPAAAAAPVTDAGPPVDIVLPSMESVTEGTVISWRKAEGDAVARDEILVDVTTDKVDIEVPSPVAGRLSAINVPDGETFPITSPLGQVTPGAGAETAPAPAAPAAPTAAAPAPSAPAATGPTPPASPLAKLLAQENGVDLRGVTGTGANGLIRKEDVRAAMKNGPAPAAAAPALAAGEVAVPLKGPAATLASYMDESLTIPTATSFRTLGVGLLDARRKELNSALAAAGRSEKLSFTHIVAWAIVQAVTRWPVMGNGYAVVDGTPTRLQRSAVNIGLAVDVERKDGSRSLLVPVVKDAAAGGFAAFVAAYDDLVSRTRGGKIGVDDLRGASVTLTNPGGLGTIASIPRLMAGQGTIIATGNIALPPGFQKADSARLAELGVEKVMNLTSTYDHRIIQGAESGGFLREIDTFLSGADGFYEGIAESLGVAIGPAPSLAPAPAATPAAAPDAPAAAPSLETLRAVRAAALMVKGFRAHGHLGAHLDPLGSEPPGDPLLDPATVRLTPALMAQVPASILRVYADGETFADVLPKLQETYCGTSAFEIEHIGEVTERRWLREQIESGRGRPSLPPERRVAVLQRLIDVEVFERFLRRTYLGQKTFSIEGVDALVPMLDKIVEMSADAGAAEIVIGMAHRGRLSVMAHTAGRPPESLLAEFEGHMEFGSESEEGVLETAGDVKYHLGAEGTFVTRSGRPITITLAANPSHLEQVNAVVEGYTRARQTIRKGRKPERDPSVAVPVLVHGDAAFPGQGVVAETLNLQALRGYSTGGTIHIIANNQIGFTTDPPDSRSTRHASDMAKGFDIPIIHVNADDPDACLGAVHLAVEYRKQFGRDVMIDLVGYRRLGHNEVDEPAYTQPVMYRTIAAHPTVAAIQADRLVKEGLLTEAQVAEMRAASEARMKAAHEAVTHYAEHATEDQPAAERTNGKSLKTAVSAETLTALNEQLLRVPDGFRVHPKLVPQLERRRAAFTEGGIVWGHAEALALASLLVEGVPVRLTGQDAGRGTFSQRHLELHDTADEESYVPRTGNVHVPLGNLVRANATLELHNSPLSEAACVGFEYGYSTMAPEALVLWEAQYGDFVNGAQIMIDQFLVSGQAKWGQRSRLTLLLPHGYEGNGPEHSSARPERFLQLCGEGNIRVANCSTAAQYFHLLRHQALTPEIKPLVVFTPKSLLRLKGASCGLEDLAEGDFKQVIDDSRVTDRAAVKRLILCTGKIFHDLDGHADRGQYDDLAIARVELLYPFPFTQIRELVESYPNLSDVHWVQEEPRNMGAWDFVTGRIRSQLPEGINLGYGGRDRRSSPSEGYPQSHQEEQARIVHAALSGIGAGR